MKPQSCGLEVRKGNISISIEKAKKQRRDLESVDTQMENLTEMTLRKDLALFRVVTIASQLYSFSVDRRSNCFGLVPYECCVALHG